MIIKLNDLTTKRLEESLADQPGSLRSFMIQRDVAAME